MTWTGTFFNSALELRGGLGVVGGVEGYFTLDGVGSVGQIPTSQDVNTATVVSFHAPNYLGRIRFFGDGFTSGTVNLPNGAVLPGLTSGTITGIEFEYNYLLARAMSEGRNDPTLFLPQLLEPSAVIQVPNVPATDLTNAIVQSYAQNNPAILQAYFSQFNFAFSGNDNANRLAGFDAADLLMGFGGLDVIFGGGGNDTLDGGPGTDALDGGEGNDLYLPGPPDPTTPVGDSVGDTGTTPGQIDTISYANAPGPVVVDLNPQDGDQSAGWARGLLASGVERVVGSAFDDVLYGTEFPESIADTANDILVGGGGNDTLVGLAGSDDLQGGPGFDVLVGGVNDNINAPGPGDIARFNASSSQVDVFFQQNGSVLVAAPGGGLDTLIEMEFLGLTDGVFAIGAFRQSSKGLLIALQEGSPLDGSGNADLLFGQAGNDVLRGFGGNDLLEGGDGADHLDGGPGADTMVGGNGGDSYVVDNFGDAITEFSTGGGIDVVVSSVDYVVGPAHLEQVTLVGQAVRATGNDLNNTLIGNDAANILDGGAGADRLEGGAGDDLYIVRAEGDLVVEALENGRDKVLATLSAALADNVEDLELLGAANLSGRGNELANDILGNTGANALRGHAGDDTLNGWSGDDTLDGGAGADLLIGGHGSDVIYVNDTADRVAESRKWVGEDTVISSVDFRMGRKHIENLELTGEARLGAGNGLRNVITGNQADNVLDGGKNVDTLIGGAGDDIYLIRAPGDNAVELADGGIDTVRAFRAHELDAHIENLHLQTLRNAAGEGIAGVNGFGNGLDNSIVGNPFDNILAGREGNDTLRGQGGADTFVFDRALGADNVDRILDFDGTEGDILRMKQSEFSGMTRGQLSTDAFAVGTVASDAGARFIFDQAGGRLYFDTDGSGAAAQQLVVTFAGNAVLTAADIEVF